MDFPKSVPGVGLVNGKFVDEDPLAARPGSLIPSAWGNAVTLEVLNVIESAGFTPDEAANDQLDAAINKKISSALPSIPGFATKDEAEAGASLTKVMSPARVFQAIAAKIGVVTSSVLDATVGRISRIGDFGLGGVGPNASDVDAITAGGVYSVAGSSAGTLPSPGMLGILLHMERNSSQGRAQIFVDSAGVLWYRSSVFGTGAWRAWSNNSRSVFDTARIDVASSETVNLTIDAPDTRHINITGTTGITGFTVEAGKCYFAKFAGVLSLKNSASLATQSGADIITASGDTCVIRALSANTVELLFYTPAKRYGLGQQQSWKNVTASRALGTTYTNTSKETIVVVGYLTNSTGGRAYVQVDAQSVWNFGAASGAPDMPFTAIVPPGSTYVVALASGTAVLANWVELK